MVNEELIPKVNVIIKFLKKRYGAEVKSKTVKSQKFEILTRVIAYNINRLITITQKIILITLKIKRVSY